MARAQQPESPAEVGEVFSSRLREARDARRWTQQELSARLAELGAPMDRTTIAKLEKGQRQARVEELVAIAVALDVSPLYLILPLRLDAKVKLAPKLVVEAIEALNWASGKGPLDRANERTYRFQAPGVGVAVWTPGQPEDATDGGGGMTDAGARQLAREWEAIDAKRKANK
jgi:transcriptional regulator with XRE-family HTH domain